jgi:hypothetical protein
MPDMNGDSPRGRGTFISISITCIGLAAARWPAKANIVFLSQHSIEVTQLLGYVLAGLGWAGSNISHPPDVVRKPVDGFKRWFTSALLRRKAAP